METRLTKLTLLLIILFVLALSVLLFSSFVNPTRHALLPAKKTIEKNIVSSSSLYFSPNSLILSPGQTASLAIVINTEGNPPEVAQLELAYDPTLLTDVQIVPGTFFSNPIIALETINQNTGRISYVLEKSPLEEAAYKNTGTLATLTFKTTSPFQKETIISFLSKTAIRTKEDINTLQSTYEAKILSH